MRMNISIHPYVADYGRRQMPPHNTAGKPNKEKLRAALRGLEEHFERHPSDAVTAHRIANIKERLKP